MPEQSNVNSSSETIEEKKLVKRGRPISRGDSRLVSYNLPSRLIDRIAREAERVAGRNKSALVELVFCAYFNNTPGAVPEDPDEGR